jgi:AraC-like DNA-binding protein
MARISVSLVNLSLRTAVQLGIDRQEILSLIDLSEEVLQNSENYVPCEIQGKIMKYAIELTGNRYFPLESGKNFEPGNLNILGYLISNAPNLRSAYEHGVRFDQIVGDGVIFSFEEKNGLVFNYIDVIAEELLPYKEYCSESCLSSIITLKRQIVSKNINPQSVHFQHAAPADIDPYIRFFECPVLFNQPRNCLVFPDSIMEEKISHSNSDLYIVFKHYAEEILQKINREDTTVRQVTKVLFKLLPENPVSIESVAERMALGVRTLQRQLKNEGSSFNKVLMTVRKELATRHLQKTSIPIAEISYLLGFAEPSIFHRSFKKWTGKTPRDFRREKLVL